MINLDEDALICDLAEVYHIFDYKVLPPFMTARLACGLRDDSRIKLKLNNSPISLNTALLAAIFDRVAWLQWANTKDAHDGLGKPDPILPILLGVKDSSKPDAVVFDDPAAFFAKREELKARINKQEGGGSNG